MHFHLYEANSKAVLVFRWSNGIGGSPQVGFNVEQEESRPGALDK
jgi:hypothetical protein